MLIDGHIHLFTPNIIANVSTRADVLKDLHFQPDKAEKRLDMAALEAALDRCGAHGALMLPTAAAHGVSRTNRQAVARAAESKILYTAGTLHPAMADPDGELAALRSEGVRAIKFSSFSQGFSLDAPETLALFETIAGANRNGAPPFFVVLDTFCRAEQHFGTDPAFITDPRRLGRLVGRFPGIVFVGAHMGGLAAPFDDIIRYLPPAENLCMDTSNAAHTLTNDEFIALLRRHGPDRIIFGTDWPWFDPNDEIPLIGDLLDRAGFTKTDRAKVFGGNMAGLLGLADEPGECP